MLILVFNFDAEGIFSGHRIQTWKVRQKAYRKAAMKYLLSYLKI